MSAMVRSDFPGTSTTIVSAVASLTAACCSVDSMSKVSLSSGMLKSNSGSECTVGV